MNNIYTDASTVSPPLSKIQKIKCLHENADSHITSQCNIILHPCSRVIHSFWHTK